MINGYTETAEKWSKRNDLHVRMIEQAGEDRVLFMNTKPHEHVDMKFPEYVHSHDTAYDIGSFPAHARYVGEGEGRTTELTHC